MTPVLTIIDDFLDANRFKQIRAEVLAKGFGTKMIRECKDGPDVPYENVQLDYMPPDFQERLPYVFGRPLQILKQAFRLGFKDSQLHNLVHSDNCVAQIAAVYFMNLIEDCVGGTAFWRHRKHGWEMMPTQKEIDDAGYSLERLAADWQDENAWTLVSLAGMKPNRMITYPTHAFHSRFPFQGFGSKDNTEHARLIYCSFFS